MFVKSCQPYVKLHMIDAILLYQRNFQRIERSIDMAIKKQ